MRHFNEFLKIGLIKIRPIDQARAKSLIESAKKRKKVMEKYLPLNEETSKQITEESYDVIRELIEAILSKDGYKSYSHEATISFLKELNFSDYDLKFVDDLRKIRNGSKYYGEDIDIEYTKNVSAFLAKIYSKLNELAEK